MHECYKVYGCTDNRHIYDLNYCSLRSCAVSVLQPAKGLESAMTAHGAPRFSKRPPMGAHTGGLTGDSLQLTRGQPALLLEDKTTASGTPPAQRLS